MNNIIKNLFIWFFLICAIIFIYKNYIFNKIIYNKINYSSFIYELNKNLIKEVYIEDKKINFINKNNKHYMTFIPINDDKLLDILLKKNIKIYGVPTKESNFLISIFNSYFPLLFLLFIWFFFINQIYNAGKNALNFGKNKAKILKKKSIEISFKDIAGYNEVKEEINEVIDFLKNPNKYKKLGCKLPKGILMIGPPGTGKTMLAKAIAYEAKIPFYSISGSDFIEMFVGVGASRVRNMFKEAKKSSPCIIFIDEIDAVGRNRGSGFGGGNDEREQTLNQMLVEMDGFNEKKEVIIIAATNRPDVLDPALLRPGRFDKQIIINLPDINSRHQILKVHIKKIPLEKDVDLLIIAKSTPGFSGADLANLVNEATFFAAKTNKKKVSMIEFEKAKDKIIIGGEHNSILISKKQKELTAYHEAGHAIVGYLSPEHDLLHKVTIIPRGNSLGITFFLPEKDNFSISKQKLESQISTLYGGRIAEEIIYGKKKVSTGAFNDIKIATSIANNMITCWGFSEKLGPLFYSNKEENFSNFYFNKKNYISDKTYYLIDLEIRFLIKKNYLISKKILLENIDILHRMKEFLIKYETINLQQIKILMNRIIIK